MSVAVGRAFLALLNQEFHELEDEEIKAIPEVLEAMAQADVFDIAGATTGYLNGKRALTIQGHWRQDNLDATVILFAAEDNGCFIQQIYYVAPPEQFARHVEVLKNALQSVSWQD